MKQIYYATRSGGTTLDVGAGGGNPFASALIELAGDPTLRLRELTTRLRALTEEKSGGRQVVECVGSARGSDWGFQHELTAGRERREALVMVVSDYSPRDSLSLSGAARDERRIAAMLAQHGFSVTQRIGRRRTELVAALQSFKRRSQQADIGVIYSTGHGLELDGDVFLLPGDFPQQGEDASADWRPDAVRVEDMAKAASAQMINLVFFAGCRILPEADAGGFTAVGP